MVYNAEVPSVYPPAIQSFYFFTHELPGAAELSFLLLTASTQSFLSRKDSSVLTGTTEMKRGSEEPQMCIQRTKGKETSQEYKA